MGRHRPAAVPDRLAHDQGTVRYRLLAEVYRDVEAAGGYTGAGNRKR